MNITAILSTIYSKISASTSTEEVLILSKIAEKIKIDNIRTVLTYAEMYTVYGSSFATGTVIFVENEEKLYYYSGSRIIPVLTLSSVAYAWGSGANGRLGDNTTVAKSSPISVVGGFTDWAQLSGGRNHSLGVRDNGTAWAWGLNTNGRLGDNSITSRLSPVSVVGGFTDWIQVSAGYTHSLGLRTNGTAWAWGSNQYGRLGNNTATSTSSPVSVVGGFTNWAQVSAGNGHTLGLRANGTAWAWGRNNYGELGDNTTVSKSSPVSVVGGYTDWVQVSAGGAHNLGLRANGTAWSWGSNSQGVLGDGSVVSKRSPVSVVGGYTDWIQVSAGNSHNLAIRTNGTAWAWGFHQYGRLGDNTAVAKSSPVSVVGGFTDWVQVSSGNDHSLGVRANGTAWAWGYGSYGRLGDNTGVAKSSPVSVVGGSIGWVQVSAGGNHSLAIIASR